MRKKRSGLGLAPDEHRARAADSLGIAKRNISRAEDLLVRGDCRKAFDALRMATANLASASAHRSSGGTGALGAEGKQRRKLLRLEHAFSTKCIRVHRHGG